MKTTCDNLDSFINVFKLINLIEILDALSLYKKPITILEIDILNWLIDNKARFSFYDNDYPSRTYFFGQINLLKISDVPHENAHPDLILQLIINREIPLTMIGAIVIQYGKPVNNFCDLLLQLLNMCTNPTNDKYLQSVIQYFEVIINQDNKDFCTKYDFLANKK